MPENSEEISLWELVFKLRDLFGYLISKWKTLLIVGVVGGAIGLVYAFEKKVQYVADLTFVLDDSKTSSLGAYAGVASQLGIDLNSGSSNGVFSADNIQEFLKSRLIIEHTLLTDTLLNGRQITLADLYMGVYEFKDKWKNKPRLRDVSFPINNRSADLSLLQDSVMQILYDDIIQQNLVVDKPDKKLGFIKITTKSLNEDFSQLFTDRLVYQAIEFYIRTKTQRERGNVDNLQKQADSLVTLLDKKTYSVAENQDLNQNPAKKVAMIDEEISNRDKTLLATMYGEVIRNLGIAKMSLVQETPIIQVIDTPIFPLRRVRMGKVTAIFIGALLSMFMCCIYLPVKKAYTSAARGAQIG